jgi:WD40 repeat protein
MVRALENHTAAVRDLAIRPAPSDSLCVVASIGEDRSIRFWQPTIGRMMRFARLDSAIPLAARWLDDGSRLAVACHDGHVRLIHPDTTEVVADHSVQTRWCYAIAIHPDENVLIAGGADGASRIARLPWTEPNQSTN